MGNAVGLEEGWLETVGESEGDIEGAPDVEGAWLGYSRECTPDSSMSASMSAII